MLRSFLKSEKWTGPIRYAGGFNVEPLLSIQTIFGEPTAKPGETDPQTDLHMDTFHSTAKAGSFSMTCRKTRGRSPMSPVRISFDEAPPRLAEAHERSGVAAAGWRGFPHSGNLA